MTTKFDFALLARLSPDVVQERILRDFCDGKTLSTLWLALATVPLDDDVTTPRTIHAVGPAKGRRQEQASSREIEKKCRNTMLDILIPQVVDQRLEAVVTFMQDKLSRLEQAAAAGATTRGADDLSTSREAIAWIRSMMMQPYPTINNNDAAAVTPTTSNSTHNDVLHTLCQRMRFVSEQMALLDFLEESVYHISKHGSNAGHFEWPIWCGKVVLAVSSGASSTTTESGGSMSSRDRDRVTAQVMITTPMRHPRCFLGLPGYSLLHNPRPCAIFQAEPYNILPVPPWGRLRPIRSTSSTTTSTRRVEAAKDTEDDDDDDVSALRFLANRLQALNHVGIPKSTFSTYSSGARSATAASGGTNVLDIRILSTNQAQARLRNRTANRSTTTTTSTPVWQPRTSWMVNDNSNTSHDDKNDVGLLCCWQEDETDDYSFFIPTAGNNNNNNERSYIAHMINFLQARERILTD